MIHTPDVLQQALACDIEQRIIALLRYPLSQANILLRSSELTSVELAIKL